MELEIKGIKCDTPHCNYREDDVVFEDFQKYLNKPCPLCGGNLLTQKDHNKCIRLKKIVKVISYLKWINPFYYYALLKSLITGKSTMYYSQIKYENDGSVTKKNWVEKEK